MNDLSSNLSLSRFSPSSHPSVLTSLRLQIFAGASLDAIPTPFSLKSQSTSKSTTPTRSWRRAGASPSTSSRCLWSKKLSG